MTWCRFIAETRLISSRIHVDNELTFSFIIDLRSGSSVLSGISTFIVLCDGRALSAVGTVPRCRVESRVLLTDRTRRFDLVLHFLKQMTLQTFEVSLIPLSCNFLWIHTFHFCYAFVAKSYYLVFFRTAGMKKFCCMSLSSKGSQGVWKRNNSSPIFVLNSGVNIRGAYTHPLSGKYIIFVPDFWVI